MINAFKKEYNLIPLVVFADTGLLSKENIKDWNREITNISSGATFRIPKTDLKISVYHRVQRRIEAHICIAFDAYKVYEELKTTTRKASELES
jgi:hypothetical protein